MRMLIYVIRHGETELNKSGVIQGATDEPLNQSGRDIAAVTGRNMRGIRSVFRDSRMEKTSVRLSAGHRISCGSLPQGMTEKRIWYLLMAAHFGPC